MCAVASVCVHHFVRAFVELDDGKCKIERMQKRGGGQRRCAGVQLLGYAWLRKQTNARTRATWAQEKTERTMSMYRKKKKHKGKQRHSTRRSNDEHAHTSRGQQTKEKRGMWREVEEGRQHHTDTPVENEMSVNNSGIQITHTTEKKNALVHYSY